MELMKLKIADIQGLETGRLTEIEAEIRRGLASMRMDVYSAQGQFAAKKRGMKKGLARLLTVKNEQRRKAMNKVT